MQFYFPSGGSAHINEKYQNRNAETVKAGKASGTDGRLSKGVSAIRANELRRPGEKV
jgi:hypothetical protein